MDTPYYEQLQYIGDTRIQALISYTVAGDDRLAHQALDAFNDSRIPEGLTRSRYPSSLPQTIPTFSLLWIGMLHDYWMYRPDPEPVREALPGIRDVLGWFATHEQPDGLLEKLPWWSFIDWVQEKEETPTYDAHGESCITTLEYLGALDDAADLEKNLGDPDAADRYHTRAAHVRAGIYDKCWTPDRGLLADNPDQKVFSQQANILAVLYDVIPKEGQQAVLRKMLAIEPGTTPNGVLSASYYFRFYLARALDHAGLADEYLDRSTPGASSCRCTSAPGLRFPAIPAPTPTPGRHIPSTTCSLWSPESSQRVPASPPCASRRTLASLGSLTASFPHPDGAITMEYRRQGAALDATITLPGSLAGTFVYHDHTWPLAPGMNQSTHPDSRDIGEFTALPSRAARPHLP